MNTSKKTTHVSKTVSHASSHPAPAATTEASPAQAATQTTPKTSAANVVTPDPGPVAPTGAVVPKPPTDWKPAKVGRGKGARGRLGQVSNAAVAAKEIASSTTYAQDFGPHAPSQARLASLIGGAAAWRGQWVSAKRWTSYAAEQNASWWEEALDNADLFQPAFDYAISRDPTIAERYPSATQFMQAASLIAKRAATVRKAKAPAKAKAPSKATATAAASGSAASEPAPTTAPAGPVADAPTPAK